MLARSLLLAASACSLLIALLHVYIIVEGAWAYRYFGAGESLANMAEQGSWLPGILTSSITLLFLVFAAYFAAAAGLYSGLPYMRVAVIGISAIYTLRGALLIPAWLSGVGMSAFDVWSSLASLGVGLLHCAAATVWLMNNGAAEGV